MTGIQARKMEVGETIKFADYVITDAYTRFGETQIVSFADQGGEIFRKVFSNSLAKFLKTQKQVSSVTLEKKLIDGEFTYNVFKCN